MIALNPQFASLFVAVAAGAISVEAAPHPGRHDRDARFVIDVNIPNVHVHARPRASSSRFIAARHYKRQANNGAVDAKAVYILPPHSPVVSGRDENHRVTLAPVGGPTPNTRRGLNDPIDEPDHNDDAQAEDANDSDGEYSSTHEEMRKRALYRVDDTYGPGLIITHAAPLKTQHPVTRSVEIYDINRRGLLDSLLPLLGSLPGVGGIINIISDTLRGVLNGLPIVGPILGGLILSPHASAATQSIDGATPSQFFLDASSSRNASTIYMVDSGQPSPFAMSSQSTGTGNATQERLVSLQMAFVNSTSGLVQAYCATFDEASDGPAALAAKPCITDGVKNVPHASQSFGYNPANQAVRPIWVGPAASAGKKRDYLVQAASADASKSDEMSVSEKSSSDAESVVLVFKAFEVVGSNSTGPVAATGAGSETQGTEDVPLASAPEDANAGAAEMAASRDAGIPVFVSGSS